MSRSAKSNLPEAIPLPVEGWNDAELCQWADVSMEKLSLAEQQKYKTRHLDCWHKLNLPYEQPPNIERFLKSWTKPGAAKARAMVMWTPKLSDMQELVLEPLAMALATPHDPWYRMWRNFEGTITQSSIDARLAGWLRNVILHKNTRSLEALIEALRRITCPLYVGITSSEIQDSLDLGPALRKDGCTEMLLQFWTFIAAHGKLPSKSELAELSEINDSSNASRYRSSLGLQGLPKGKQTW